MSNGNWVNEVGNQGMMFLFCSARKKIGSLFFCGSKPYSKSSGQRIGRREFMNFSPGLIELKHVSDATQVTDQP